MPVIGSTVWVQFEGGDLNQPVWTGITWDTAMLADQAITSATSVTVRAPVVTVLVRPAGELAALRSVLSR